MNKTIAVMGVPMWLGQSRYGANLGPRAIRGAGLLNVLRRGTCPVVDKGNIDVGIARAKNRDSNIKNVRSVAAACEKLAHSVYKTLRDHQFPLVLGGDHSIAIGTLAGAAKYYDHLGVIWFDAHTDINTPSTSPTGNIHGMPLAVSLGQGYPSLIKVGGAEGKIKSENIVYIGVRDIDPGERDFIAEHHIKVYTAADVHRLGMKQVVAETVAYLSERCNGIHLSFDLDGIDPLEAPGVGTPVPGGIDFAAGLALIRLLADTQLITSAEFVEVNPLLDRDNKTAQLAVDLIAALLAGNLADQDRPEILLPYAEAGAQPVEEISEIGRT